MAHKQFYATTTFRYANRMLQSGDPVMLSGPEARLFLKMGRVADRKPRAPRAAKAPEPAPVPEPVVEQEAPSAEEPAAVEQPILPEEPAEEPASPPEPEPQAVAAMTTDDVPSKTASKSPQRKAGRPKKSSKRK